MYRELTKEEKVHVAFTLDTPCIMIVFCSLMPMVGQLRGVSGEPNTAVELPPDKTNKKNTLLGSGGSGNCHEGLKNCVQQNKQKTFAEHPLERKALGFCGACKAGVNFFTIKNQIIRKKLNPLVLALQACFVEQRFFSPEYRFSVSCV